MLAISAGSVTCFFSAASRARFARLTQIEKLRFAVGVSFPSMLGEPTVSHCPSQRRALTAPP
jgi:hypothetical protein